MYLLLIFNLMVGTTIVSVFGRSITNKEKHFAARKCTLSTPSVSSFSDSSIDTVVKYNENGAE